MSQNNVNATVNAARQANAALVDQVHRAAEAVALIGQDDLSRAVAHLKHECEQLNQRRQAALDSVIASLSAVVEAFAADTSTLDAGMTLEQPECPLLGIAAVNLTPPTVEQEQPTEQEPAQASEGSEDSIPRKVEINYQDMAPLSRWQSVQNAQSALDSAGDVQPVQGTGDGVNAPDATVSVPDATTGQDCHKRNGKASKGRRRTAKA